MVKTNKKKVSLMMPYFIFIPLLFIVAYLLWDKLLWIFSNPEAIRGYVSGFGAFGPIILILLQIVQVNLFFIPGAILLVAAGYVYGIFWGVVYSWIGLILGSSIIFLLGRKLGRPFVEKFTKKQSMEQFDSFFEERGALALLISRTIPIGFPSDLASLVVSLTSMRFSTYLIVTAIGYIPHVIIIVAFGNQIVNGFDYSSIIIFSVIGFVLLIYVLWKPIKNLRRQRKEDKLLNLHLKDFV